MLPYDAEALRALIESFNRALWPAHLVALVLGGLALWLATHPRGNACRLLAALLAAAWLATGAVYLAGFYATLNWAGWVYALVFTVQAVAMAWHGVLRGRPEPGHDRAVWWPGAGLAFVALLPGPLFDALLGGSAAAVRFVGLSPDATAVFTLGVLLGVRGLPRRLLLLPAAWCGWSALWWWQLQTPAHAVLPALALLVTALSIRRHRAGG